MRGAQPHHLGSSLSHLGQVKGPCTQKALRPWSSEVGAQFGGDYGAVIDRYYRPLIVFFSTCIGIGRFYFLY